MSTKQNSPEPLAVSQREAARLLSVSERTVFDLRRAGKLRSLKVGAGPKSKVLIVRQSIIDYLAGAVSAA